MHSIAECEGFLQIRISYDCRNTCRAFKNVWGGLLSIPLSFFCPSFSCRGQPRERGTPPHPTPTALYILNFCHKWLFFGAKNLSNWNLHKPFPKVIIISDEFNYQSSPRSTIPVLLMPQFLLKFSLCLVRPRFFVSNVFSYKHVWYFEK